jgi:dipeptidase
MHHMRNHYENTPLAMDGSQFSDVGAIYASVPVRAHPLTWSSGGKSYLNERPIATQQTGWNFVAQSRSWMPTELSGLLWFGVDDSGATVRFPIYGSASQVPEAFAGKGAQDGVTPPVMKFSMDRAFDVFNLVANWVYSRWDLMYPDLMNRVNSIESEYFAQVEEMDKQASDVYKKEGPKAAVDLVTKFSVDLGNDLLKRWVSFFGELFVKYRDGYVITESKDSPACGCSVANGAYPQNWYDRIALETGDHYLVPAEVSTAATRRDLPAHLRPVDKHSILSKK